MFDVQKSLEMIEGFKTHYNYDTAYMEEMLKISPASYEVFEAFLPMATFVNKAPVDVINIARITAIKNEDCGTCVQLYVDLAIEAGLDKEVAREIIFNKGESLSLDLKLVYDFTLAVSNNETIDANVSDRMNQTYSREVMMEISLAIAATKVFPTIKRVLNYMQSCSVIQIKV
ncbi:hypothetical protein [Sulfuricurvum sp.]|uniref:hypothetical protein n=1 Tax=Sulfuricurvum sp. TaxID=2025608 RepID=UPI0025DA6488|nr:hypothetical protein [Sulfuricurvum sp.]